MKCAHTALLYTNARRQKEIYFFYCSCCSFLYKQLHFSGITLKYVFNFSDSSFAIRCGGDSSLTAQDGTVYQPDNTNLSAASYYVTGIC